MRSPLMNNIVRWMANRGWVITSEYRDEGTHQHGAIDFGARAFPQGSLAESGVHGCRHPRAMRIGKDAQAAFPQLAVYLESDHIHVHDPSALPAGLRNAPRPGVEITNQCGNKSGDRRFVQWREVQLYKQAERGSPKPCECGCTVADTPYAPLFALLQINQG
jgi:hypothetical protein